MDRRSKKKYVYMAVLVVFVGLIVFMYNRGPSVKAWPVTTLNGTALGTVYQVSVKGTMPEGLREGLDSLFNAADESLSVFNPDSRLSRINDNRTDTADRYIIYCIELARGVSELSNGMYDITIRPLVAALGFSGEKPLPQEVRDSLLQFVGYDKIRIEGSRIIKENPGVQIDLNSIAKGAVVDMAARFIEQSGVEDYLVDIGGEIFCRGTNAEDKEWVIGVETPFEGNYSMTGEYVHTILSFSDAGLATSGNYRNYYVDENEEKYTHIINPKTGGNTSGNLLSATVIAESCALADAYGTMFISLGYEKAVETAEKNNIPALFIYADGDKMLTYATKQMKKFL